MKNQIASAALAAIALVAAPATAQDSAETSVAALPLAAAQSQANVSVMGASDRAVAEQIRRKARSKYKKFYADRGYWPMWVENGAVRRAADTLITLMQTSRIDGLSPADYDISDLREAVVRARSGTAEDLARAELMLSQGFAGFARDMQRVRQSSLTYYDDAARPAPADEAEVLRRAALASSIDDYVAQLGWMNPAYGGLRNALARHSERMNVAPGLTIPAGPTLRAGQSGNRVRLLRLKLGLSEGTAFDAELSEAVAAFQRDHGLSADGIVGRNTLAALNTQPIDQSRKLRLNLERARDLPGPWERHILVNVAAQELTLYNDGKVEGRMKVVVGTPETPTPMMAGMVRYATLNPYWNVPVDFVKRRIAPGVLAGASLQKLGYEALSDWTRDARPLDADAIDWRAVASGQEQVRVRELPGPGNSMGSVKFMFPNDQGIYLHDTPNRALFGKDSRAFSNGCVRLEDAGELGRWLFGSSIAAEGDAPEQNRSVPRPVPVYLTYLTAVPGERGIRFLPDIYERDTMRPMQVAGR